MADPQAARLKSTLHLAALHGNVAALELVLALPGAEAVLNEPDEGGQTALELALAGGHRDAAQLLLAVPAVQPSLQRVAARLAAPANAAATAGDAGASAGGSGSGAGQALAEQAGLATQPAQTAAAGAMVLCVHEQSQHGKIAAGSRFAPNQTSSAAVAAAALVPPAVQQEAERGLMADAPQRVAAAAGTEQPSDAQAAATDGPPAKRAKWTQADAEGAPLGSSNGQALGTAEAAPTGKVAAAPAPAAVVSAAAAATPAAVAAALLEPVPEARQQQAEAQALPSAAAAPAPAGGPAAATAAAAPNAPAAAVGGARPAAAAPTAPAAAGAAARPATLAAAPAAAAPLRPARAVPSTAAARVLAEAMLRSPPVASARQALAASGDPFALLPGQGESEEGWLWRIRSYLAEAVKATMLPNGALLLPSLRGVVKTQEDGVKVLVSWCCKQRNHGVPVLPGTRVTALPTEKRRWKYAVLQAARLYQVAFSWDWQQSGLPGDTHKRWEEAALQALRFAMVPAIIRELGGQPPELPVHLPSWVMRFRSRLATAAQPQAP
ncbi:hypothetical protein ABPG75_001627 [Micractinium tetrahymenae]